MYMESKIRQHHTGLSRTIALSFKSLKPLAMKITCRSDVSADELVSKCCYDNWIELKSGQILQQTTQLWRNDPGVKRVTKWRVCYVVEAMDSFEY